MAFSKRIVIERNSNPDELACAGSISGETEDGRRWILFLDAQGQPEVYWPTRGEDGAVIGEAIRLDRRPGQFSGVFEQLKVPDDADADPANEEVVASFPVFFPDDTEMTYDENGRYTNSEQGVMRGIIFAVVPGEGTARERMHKFTRAVFRGYDHQGDRAADGWEISPSDPEPSTPRP